MTTTEWLEQLTPRQEQVVLLIVTGEVTSAPAIARQLFVQPDTVMCHLKAAYERLGVDGRIGLVVGYWQHRVADLEEN